MEAPPYTDTILLEANRKSSAEFLAGNFESNNAWTNDLGSGIKLEIGDTISVHSAYISEIGNEESTIEIKGKNAINNLGENQSYSTINVSLTKTDGEKNNGSTTLKLQTQEGNVGWDYTTTTTSHPIRDDEIHMTHSYYKCAQGDNYMTLPRKWASNDKEGWYQGAKVWSEYNTSETGAVYEPNPYRIGSDYTSTRYFGQANGYGYNVEENGHGQTVRTEIANDGSRFTLFVRKSFKNYVPEGQKTGNYLQGQRDPAMMDFIWYKKTVKYEVTKGFNSPANVSTQITNTMKDAINIDNYSYGEENESASSGDEYTRRDGQIKSNFINLQAQSNTYELFPCATAWMIRSAGDHWFNDSYSTDKEIDIQITANGSFQISGNQNQVACPHTTGAFGTTNLFPGDRLVALTRNTVDISSAIPNMIGSTAGSVRVTTKSHDANLNGTIIAFDRQAAFGTIEYAPGYFTFKFTDEHTTSFYESAYSTVGFKRPEIQEAGRELMDDPNFERGTMDGSFETLDMVYPLTLAQDDQKSTLLTTLDWTEDNLQKLKKLFDAEGLHPELFDYEAMSASQQELINQDVPDLITVNTMRFLHMNDADGDDQGVILLEYNSSTTPVETETGNYIIVTNANPILLGARLLNSEKDIDNGDNRFYPNATYVTKVDYTNHRIYLSQPFNASYVPDVGGDMIFSFQGLGNDAYYNNAARAEYSHKAGAVFFDYNPARKDIATGEGLGSNTYESLTYGFAKKIDLGDEIYKIGFSVEKYQNGTIPEKWFHYDVITNRAIGFDKHFNAYGTAAILLYNGYASLWGADYNASSIEGSTFHDAGFQATTNEIEAPLNDVGTMYRTFQAQPAWDGWFRMEIQNANKFGPGPPISPYWAILYNEIYCGANQPSLQFDSESSRFSFVNLHTPELIGTNAESVNNGSDVADSNTPCFKLNKRLSRLTYSPNFTPYNNVFKVSASNQLDGAAAEKDQNTVPYAIMDAQSGIYIEDYGCDEANWSQSLWELMGFTYSQFHNTGSRLQRFNNTGLTTSTPTTNALIKTEDLQNLVTRGSSQLPINNTLEVNYPAWRYSGSGVLPSGSAYTDRWKFTCFSFPGYLSYPPTTQQAESTSIIAENLPRKMLSPIYLIKSDLLNPTYIGGREGTSSLPIIAVVDKSSGYGDYYTGAKDSTIFTNTIPRTIQNIKTSIVDADGSESRVDDGCCVIYKITKQIKSNKYVLENILNPQPPQK